MLVAALRPEVSLGLKRRAVPVLERLADRRTVECLIRLLTDEKTYIDDFGRDQCCHALAVITGVTLEDGEAWRAWWDAHRAEYPPQLDPKTVNESTR